MLQNFEQRTLNIGGSITVWLTTCLTGLYLTKQVNMLLINRSKEAKFKENKQEVSRTVTRPLKFGFSALKC